MRKLSEEVCVQGVAGAELKAVERVDEGAISSDYLGDRILQRIEHVSVLGGYFTHDLLQAERRAECRKPRGDRAALEVHVLDHRRVLQHGARARARRRAHTHNFSLLHDDAERSIGHNLLYARCAPNVAQEHGARVREHDGVRDGGFRLERGQAFVLQSLFGFLVEIRRLGEALEVRGLVGGVWGCELGDAVDPDLLGCGAESERVAVP